MIVDEPEMSFEKQGSVHVYPILSLVLSSIAIAGIVVNEIADSPPFHPAFYISMMAMILTPPFAIRTLLCKRMPYVLRVLTVLAAAVPFFWWGRFIPGLFT